MSLCNRYHVTVITSVAAVHVIRSHTQVAAAADVEVANWERRASMRAVRRPAWLPLHVRSAVAANRQLGHHRLAAH